VHKEKGEECHNYTTRRIATEYDRNRAQGPTPRKDGRFRGNWLEAIARITSDNHYERNLVTNFGMR
jgi:hypothetical protein